MDEQQLNKEVRERYGAEHIVAFLKTGERLPSQFMPFIPEGNEVWWALFTGRAIRLVAIGSQSRFLEDTLLSRGETGAELGLTIGMLNNPVLKVVRSIGERRVNLDLSVRLELVQQVLVKTSELFAVDDLAKAVRDETPSLSACRVCSKPVKPYSLYCKWCGTKVQVAS